MPVALLLPLVGTFDYFCYELQDVYAWKVSSKKILFEKILLILDKATVLVHLSKVQLTLGILEPTGGGGYGL